MIKKKLLFLLFIFLFLSYTPLLKAKDGFGEVILSKGALHYLTSEEIKNNHYYLNEKLNKTKIIFC